MRGRCIGGLLVVLLLAGPSAVAAQRQVQVVGGAPAPASYAFVAALLRPDDGRHFCGGALIRPTWVVTAAHCVGPLQGNANAKLALGRADWTTKAGEEHAIKAITRHPDWSQQSAGGDIALIELARPSAITPAPLLAAADEPTWNGSLRQATVAGWGYTTPGAGPSNVLRAAAIPVFAPEGCSRLDPGFSSQIHLCAGDAQATACNGDSGGPLLVEGPKGLSVVGVSSRGPQVCGRSPSFYTRLAGYADWMASVMGPATTAPPTTTPPAVQGLSVLAADGTVRSFGSARSAGDAAACKGPKSCVDLAARPAGGYWISSGSCDLRSFGGAPQLPSPATDERCWLAANPKGNGLWAATPSGRVFNVGGAPAHGNGPKGIVGIEARAQGGYWLLGGGGAVSGYGGAPNAGSLGGKRLSAPVVAMAASPSGKGYWLVQRDGVVAGFGDAKALGAQRIGGAVGLVPTASGAGYWVVGADGSVGRYGDARELGNARGKPGPMVAAVGR